LVEDVGQEFYRPDLFASPFAEIKTTKMAVP
jgi:hypothetical protein